MSLELDWNFYFITDSNLTRKGVVEDVRAAIAGGAKVIQYREKTLPEDKKLAEAKELSAICRDAGVHLLINDDVQLALASGADGVHLGQDDMSLEDARQLFPEGIIGVSCNEMADVHDAERKGASYIAVSPVFFTTTKEDISRPLGLDGIREFSEVTGLHVVAIGGIKLDNVRDVILAGADSVCAISATVVSDDVEKSVRSFEEIISKAKTARR